MDLWEEEIKTKVHHVIKGSCVGVVLYQRGSEDNHICIQTIIEDDENWFISTADYSSFWLREHIRIMQQAEEWLNKNATHEVYGWYINS